METKTMLSYAQTLSPYLRISKDRCEILSGITDEERFGAVLYGLAVGTPPAQMVEILGRVDDTDQLFIEFHQMFVDRSRDTDQMYQLIEEKRIQVDRTVAAHDELMDKYHEELKFLMEHTIRDAEDKVKDRDFRITEKNEQIKKLEDEIKSLREELKAEHEQTRIANEKNAENLMLQQVEPAPAHSSFWPWNKRSRTMQQERDRGFREQELKKYRDAFFLSMDYNDEQKQLFMECYNSGMSFDRVSNLVGNPKLSVEVMREMLRSLE